MSPKKKPPISPVLTPKQKAMLDFIQAYAGSHGYAPSQQEIAKHFGFKSLGTVQNYLVRLERQGILRKTWNARRGMKVTETPPHVSKAAPLPIQAMASQVIQLPLLGRVAAGRPIEAVQSNEHLDVPASMIKGGSHFVLRVTGDSMIEEGILHGDYVVIRKQSAANNGQTVVALIGNEATIKKFYRKGSRVELHPANPAYHPLIIESLVESTEFKIEGVLVGLIRRVDNAVKNASERNFPVSFLDSGIPRGALCEVSGSHGGGKSELVLRFLAENPKVRAAWIEEEFTIYPCAFFRFGVDLSRVLFSEAGAETLWAAHQILRSQLFGAVILTAPAASELDLRRLQLAAEKAQASVILLAEEPMQEGSWPIQLQLETFRRSGEHQSQIPEFHIRKTPDRLLWNRGHRTGT